MDQSQPLADALGWSHTQIRAEVVTMSHSIHRSLHAFFLFNLVLAITVLAGALVLSFGGESLTLLEQQRAEGMLNRVALAALLYAVFAWYADLYFRPRQRAGM